MTTPEQQPEQPEAPEQMPGTPEEPEPTQPTVPTEPDIEPTPQPQPEPQPEPEPQPGTPAPEEPTAPQPFEPGPLDFSVIVTRVREMLHTSFEAYQASAEGRDRDVAAARYEAVREIFNLLDPDQLWTGYEGGPGGQVTGGTTTGTGGTITSSSGSGTSSGMGGGGGTTITESGTSSQGRNY